MASFDQDCPDTRTLDLFPAERGLGPSQLAIYTLCASRWQIAKS